MALIGLEYSELDKIDACKNMCVIPREHNVMQACINDMLFVDVLMNALHCVVIVI